jgi:LPS-assembly lipoprotein
MLLQRVLLEGRGNNLEHQIPPSLPFNKGGGEGIFSNEALIIPPFSKGGLGGISSTLSLLLLAIITFTLTACGWHLRGTTGMELSIAPLYLNMQKGSPALRNDLRDALNASGAKLVSSTDEAELILIIHNEKKGRRVMSVGSSGKVSDYELQYTIVFSVKDKAGNDVIPQDSISQQRDYSFDETQALAKGEEERRLFDFMRRMSIQSLMRRLQTLNETSTPAAPATPETSTPVPETTPAPADAD